MRKNARPEPKMRMTPLLLAALVACGGSSSDVKPEPEPEPPPPVPEGAIAVDLDITKVSVFQGVEIVLTEDGAAPVEEMAPIVAGRDMLVRIHVEPHDSFTERVIRASVTVGTGAEATIITADQLVEGPSTQGKLGTTLNVAVDGTLVTEDLALDVSVRENGETAVEGTEGIAVWTSDEVGGLVTFPTDVLDVVIVPIQYDADGSGRLPDTSPAALEQLRQVMLGMYPASEVVLTVADPYPWDRAVNAGNDAQWSALLFRMNLEREAAGGARPNTYFYGLFDPADSFNQYCRFGCILGLSLVATNPRDPFFRASIGLGYPEVAGDTMAHELGHAHGREHAPCGLFGQQSDPDYPHPDAELGTWGFNIVTNTLFKPTSTFDIMSYCEPVWISDYTYFELFKRIRTIEAQGNARSAKTEWQAIALTDTGQEWMPELARLQGPPPGALVDVALLDADGNRVGQTLGSLVRYGDIAGGMLLVPPTPPDVVRVHLL